MFRKSFISLSLLFLATFLWVSGCADNKTPSSASSADTTESSTNPTENNSSGGVGNEPSGSVDLSALPTVHFGFNEYTLNGEDRDRLKAAADALKKNKVKLTVEGHCDERGSSEYNLALGEKRAQSVKTYLQKLGVSSEKIGTISYGKERPVAMGQNEEAWAKNRRGELVVNR